MNCWSGSCSWRHFELVSGKLPRYRRKQENSGWEKYDWHTGFLKVDWKKLLFTFVHR